MSLFLAQSYKFVRRKWEKEGRKKFFNFFYNRVVKKCKSPPPFIYFIIIFAVFFGRGTDIATSLEKCVKAQTLF